MFIPPPPLVWVCLFLRFLLYSASFVIFGFVFQASFLSLLLLSLKESLFYFLSLLGICGESSYSCERSTALSCSQELVCACSLPIPIQVSTSLHVPALPSTCGSFTPTFPFPPRQHAAESFGHPAFRSHTPAATRTADTRGCRVTVNVSHRHWWALVVPTAWGEQERSSPATFDGKPFFSCCPSLPVPRWFPWHSRLCRGGNLSVLAALQAASL